MDVDLFTQTPAAAIGDLERLGYAGGAAPAAPKVAPGPLPGPATGRPVLATGAQ
jgi:NADH-quinone oxidoreductase subunit G